MTMIIVHSLIMLQALSVTKGFSVSGSDEPLVAALGEDIILPCNVDTPVPLEELELEWIKKDKSSLVHLSIAGVDQPESQHKSYRNRTQIFNDKLLTGDYSLKLKKTEVQDEGKYRCVVHSRNQSEEVIVELKSVERLFVTGTNGPLFVYAGGEIVLNCFVDTHTPIEKLEVQWVKAEDETLVHLFVEGEDQPESQNPLYKGRTELFNESLADGNFSLKLKSVGMKDKGIYKCNVHTNTESAETTIELDVGPSVLHIFYYVFSIGSLLIGLGTVIQAGCYLFSKTQSKMGYYCFYVNISIPHILMAFAFVLLGILEEGNWAETVLCITTNLLRVVLLFLIVSDKLRALGLCQGICFRELTRNVFVINIIIIETVMVASVISEIQRKKILNLKDELFVIICVTFALFILCSIVIYTFRIVKVFFHRSFLVMRCVEKFNFKNVVLLHYVLLLMYTNFISNRSGILFIGEFFDVVLVCFFIVKNNSKVKIVMGMLLTINQVVI
ncbi:uncharacterized protein LOC114645293 isoform X1 [Erpetoichthys calabaricus]|uniref:uncharacterized protein LOC114645293 isoform X1 n=1 Tax=Erpetoichthys calabaricus TaxID=27687 RepID=UPI0022345FF5|nr:uncharacterized protein LOC114645293 isoform X1 [Erpetoichthys calabaricus]